MSAGQKVLYVLRKTGLVLGALLLVTVLLSAMPGHHAPAVQLTTEAQEQQSSPPPSHDMQGMDHASMPGIDMDDAKVKEQSAVSDMTGGHHDVHNLHMKMTAMRPRNDQDVDRAKEIAAHLREGIEKYKDDHTALNDGYKIFLPNVPHPNITSPTIGRASSRPTVSIRPVPLPCSTRKPPPATNSSAPCTPCPSAPPENS
jgi:hypothetical protein